MTSNIDKFQYSDAPQRSPEWVEIRVGKPSASSLYRWLAVSKRDGSPLKDRKDYEAELAFECEFKVPFTRFVSGAMEQGQMMEEFLKRQYEQHAGVIVRPVGCYYNDYFVASPDGEIDGDGLIECKWVFDSTFTNVLTNGVPEAHMLQMQGQMWASGRKWCDYVVGNQTTSKYVIIRVERDEKVIGAIRDSLKDATIQTWIKTDNVFDFTAPPTISILRAEENFDL